MKIAIYHELPKGGARRAINEFSKILKKNNIVDLYVLDADKIDEKSFFSRTFVYLFKTKEWAGKSPLVKLYKDFFEIFLLFIVTKKIAKIINNRKYDITIVSASRFIESPFIMRFLKSPFVFYASDPNYRYVYDELLKPSKSLGIVKYRYEVLKRKIYKSLDKENIKYAKLCLSPSSYIAKKFEETYQQRSLPLLYGVDTTFFTPSSRSKDIDILYIGSHNKIDGVDLLDSVVKLLPKTTKVKKILIEDEWISDDSELRDIYRRSKIIFCPARKEGLGAVPMEGMSCGCVVMAVNEAGHRETIINGTTGYLVSRNPIEIKKLIASLLEDDKKRKLIGEKAREIMVRDWSWKKRGNLLERELEKFISKNQLDQA